MKRLFFILAACLSVTAASAQTIAKGSFMINPSLTNLGFNAITISADGGKSSVSRIGLQATGGYAVIDDLAIVAGVGFQSSRSEGSGVSFLNFVAGARYYFVPGFYGGASFVFGNLSFQNNSKHSNEVPSGTNVGSTLGIEVNAGYSYFLSERFALQPSLSFYYGLSNKIADSSFNLNMFSVNFGFIYLL